MSDALLVGNLVEAVIISGPRRGEIVKVDLDRQEILGSAEMDSLQDALRCLDGALVGLTTETRDLRRVLRDAAAEI